MGIDALYGLIDKIITAFEGMYTTVVSFSVSSAVSSDLGMFTTLSISLANFLLVITMTSEAAKLNALDRWEDAFKLGIKLIVCKFIIQNTTNIGGAIYNFFFQSTAASSITSITATIKQGFSNPPTIVDNSIIKYLTSIGAIFVTLEIIIVFILMAMILFSLCSIMFEIGMHLVLAPLVVPTLINEHTRSIGISFIKNFAAVCLQLSMMGVMCTVYDSLNSSFTSLSTLPLNGLGDFNVFGYILKGLYPILMLIIFTLALSKSGEFTKRMLGA